jgi:hypothetical protein
MFHHVNQNCPPGLVAVPSCVTKRSIELLNKLQQPRAIYVVVPEITPCILKLQVLATNVHCIDEQTIIPGLTKAKVGSILVEAYPQMETEQFKMGRSPAGWYLQQVHSYVDD